MKNLIAQGAEAKLFLEDNIIHKNRFKKTYRIKEIDEKLRKFRTKREAKVLKKLQDIDFDSPKLISNDQKENLEIEFIKGKLLKDILNKKNYIELGKQIGEKVSILHNKDIIHGDLTTSNMIFNNRIYFIDFGLSFFSHKIEDRAVDLHLLKEALESKHHEIWEDCYKIILDVYEKLAKYGKETLIRIKVVESRGRYKGKK